MRLIFWVTALAMVTTACAKNLTAKAKPKRQLESIRSAHDFQYSLVLPHSRVQHFRALTGNRRISNGTPKSGKLPPYAVQMEPVVQYSQKDPLYDPSLDNVEDLEVNKNEITAQPKILNVDDQVLEGSYGPPYGSLPTAPLYSQDSQHYYEEPEPIIEIIIKESNESLPAPPPQQVLKKKKEPVQVFYVKYTKDPHHHDKVIYEKPIPAITPPSNHEDDHHEDYVTVTPEPLYLPPKTTTLRAIIKPESEVYHSDSSVKVTFGSESHYHGDTFDHSEGHEETAPRPAIAIPQSQPSRPPLERSASSSSQQYHNIPLNSINNPNLQNYKTSSQQAQSRIQFQQPYLSGEPQLPRQGPTLIPFRNQQIPRQNSFAPTALNAHPTFANRPVNPTAHFSNITPTVPGPVGPILSPGFSRGNNGPPSFQQRPSAHPQFAPRPQFNVSPRPTFHAGPQRPFHQTQQQPFFDEPKYLAENYHTITTDQVDPPKEQGLPVNRQPPVFNSNVPRPGPSLNPAFHDHRQQLNFNQQLPHQRPIQPFNPVHNKPVTVTPNRSPFFNLKPSPPHIEGNHIQFQQNHQHQVAHQNQISFHSGPQSVARPATQQPTPTPISQNQFLPQPSSPSLYNFRPQQSSLSDNSFQHSQPSERPQFINRQPSERPLLQQFHSASEQPQILQSHSPSERPHFSQPLSPSERPQVNHHAVFQDQSNLQHQHNIGNFVPNNGELIASIPKYEQHITVSGPTAQTNYAGFSETNQISPTSSNINVQYHQQQQEQEQQRQQQQQQRQQQQQQRQQQQQQQLQLQQQQQKQQQQEQHKQQQQQQQQQHQQQHQLQQQQHQHQQNQQQIHQQQLQQQQIQQQQYQESQQQQQNLYDTEQEQLKIQLAENVKKQQEEIQRLQAQLLYSQQQHQQQQHQQNVQQDAQYEQQLRNAVQQYVTSPRPQLSQERSRQQQPTYATSTASPNYYQSTSRTIEIKPTTQKYVSSTINSINSTPETKREEKKKKPAIELPDEVPDDLRQQLLSSGILDNADISVLDYDKIGDTPLESLPQDQLANFFSAGGGQQIASSELRPIVVKPNGDKIESRIDSESDDDQDGAASENVPTYVSPPSKKQAVEMKVVHFDPNTAEGKNIANEYVKKDATQVEPVALNDKKYNRYLPLKVSGNQFPLPDILKGRKVTSVVVLAPVETEDISNNHARSERAASETLKGIKFVAGPSLQDLLKKPSRENFQRWLDIEKKTAADLQSVVLLVTGNDEMSSDREIYMYDISSGNVNKLNGDLSNAFIEAADNNSLTKDIEQLAIEGDGIPEEFNNGNIADASENVPFLVDLSGVSANENSNTVSIASGYSKTKLGRSLRRQ